MVQATGTVQFAVEERGSEKKKQGNKRANKQKKSRSEKKLQKGQRQRRGDVDGIDWWQPSKPKSERLRQFLLPYRTLERTVIGIEDISGITRNRHHSF